MTKKEATEYFSKQNTESYIYLLHEYGKFDINKFNEFLNNYNKLIKDYDKEFISILQEATDILIYTVSCLSFHHYSMDVFKITNYDEYNIDGLYDDYWGYDNIDNYIISKTRESISNFFTILK